MHKKIFFFIFFLYFQFVLISNDILWALPLNSFESIKDEFNTISASINKLENQEIIIDKGEDHGIKKGDYFQIFKRGDAALDPDTKEIIGYLKTKQAIIQVKNLLKDSAYCEIVSGEGPFYVGQQLIRFSGIDAVFIGNDAVSKDIKAVLVELNWLPAGYNSLLKFVQKGNKLEVFDHNSKKIRELELQVGGAKKGAPQKNPEKNTNLYIERLHKDINETVFAKISADLIQFDVDKSGENLFFLTTDGFFVTPYRKKGESNIIYSIGGIYKPVSFSLSKDGGYISLNLIIPEVGYKAIIFENSGTLQKLRKDINMYLSFEGEALYAQGLEKDRMPSQRVFNLDILGQDIHYLSEEIFPDNFALKNSCFMDFGQDGSIENIFYHDNKIFIKGIDNNLNIFELPATNAFLSGSGFYCMKEMSDNKALVAVNKDIIIIAKEQTGFTLKTTSILKDNESFVGINKIGNEIIIGVKTIFNDSVITTLKSFPAKEFF